jgi:dehydrogenase/reductase SDR family protein 7B
MKKNFNEMNVWITGASSGIGEALAIEFARLGSNLILSSRNEEKLKLVAAQCVDCGVNVIIAPLDLESEESIKLSAAKVLQDCPKIDILINNGGISQRSYAEETPVSVDRRIMETNFFGAITITKEVLPALIKDGGGHIIVISSVTGKFGFPLRTAYSASKHALQGFFEALRAELFEKNVMITIVSPGRIYTNISLNAINKNGERYGVMDKGQAKGMPADICARKIIRAVKCNRKELWIGGKEVLLVYFRIFFPILFHYLARKVKPV